MIELENFLRNAFDLQTDAEPFLDAAEMAMRAAIIYIATLFMVRVGKKRFMGRATAFDLILGIILGSVVSRAITGNAPFFPTLAAAAVLVFGHWIFSALAVRWNVIGFLIKGRDRLLVRNGEIDRKSLRAAQMSEHDLWEGLRQQGVNRLEHVQEARLERDGDVSVITAEAATQVLEVSVADGVQTVRIKIDGR